MGWREVMAGQPAIEVDAVEHEEDGAQPPGWYPDPQGPGTQRYWDGQSWGEEWSEKPKRPKPTGKANRLAITALICASLAPFLVGGILATVFGMVALDEIEESEGKERGAGIAQWAIGLGFLNIAVSCAAIVLVVMALTRS